MRIWKIGLVIIVLFVLYILTWFVYTRFCLDKYEMSGNTLTYKNNVYVRKDSLFVSDENLGKTIGIAIEEKRTITVIFSFAQNKARNMENRTCMEYNWILLEV